MACRLTALSIDAHDPTALADFWCAALGWHVLADPEGNEFCLLRGRVAP